MTICPIMEIAPCLFFVMEFLVSLIHLEFDIPLLAFLIKVRFCHRTKHFTVLLADNPIAVPYFKHTVQKCFKTIYLMLILHCGISKKIIGINIIFSKCITIRSLIYYDMFFVKVII